MNDVNRRLNPKGKSLSKPGAGATLWRYAHEYRRPPP
jgi:hypothetical protein